MTSVKEAADICGALGKEDVNNVTLSYNGLGQKGDLTAANSAIYLWINVSAL